MSLQATPVTAAGNGYYFALATDPGLGQTLSLTGDTLAISGGNSVDVANATTVSTSKVKLTAQTYIAGFNTTNFTGDVRSEGRVISAPPLGLGTATLNGGLANVTITGIAGNNPSVLFQKSVNSASIVYDGTDISISTIKVSTMSVKAEIYDSFGSPGAAGQQLQSSGPGLGTVWGAGSGVGLTAVIAGSNIAVDNTNPIAPVVSLSINSTINMNGFNIVNGNDIQLKGTNPSVDFKNTAGVDKAFLDYVEAQDKITLSALNVVNEAVGAGRGHRMILDAAGAALTSQDADTTLQRSQTGLGIRTIATLEDNGEIQVGAPGIGTNPTISLVPTTGATASISNTASKMSIDSLNRININAVTEVNVDCPNGDLKIGDVADVGGQAKIIIINSNGSSILNLLTQGGAVQVALEDTNGGTIALNAPNSWLELRKGGTDGLLQLGQSGLTSFPTLRLQSGVDPTEFVSVSYNSTTSKGTIQTGPNGQLDILSDSSMIINSGGAVDIQAPNDPITLSANDSAILMNSSVQIDAIGEILVGAITKYNTVAGVQNTVVADVDSYDQVLTNNAYVPMTAYATNIAFTINPAATVAFDTNSMPGGQLFRWRYSGQLAPSGLNNASRYCGATRFQVDVNIASRDWDAPDTITWWVELNDLTNSQVYEAQDFGNSGQRSGFITTSQNNPANGGSICHTVSFSSIFDLSTGIIPNDGDDCFFTVYGWGANTTSTPKTNVSVSIRPMRNLV